MKVHTLEDVMHFVRENFPRCVESYPYFVIVEDAMDKPELEKLRELVASMSQHVGKDGLWSGEWNYSPELPSGDINREIAHPSEQFPDGALGIRADGNFWQVALLPYWCVNLTIGEIASVLWPKEHLHYGDDALVDD